MFGSNNKFDPNKDIPDLSGKVYIVTGGSAGIGFGISAHILQHNPSKLYILGNKIEHLDSAKENLKSYGDVSKVELIQCDLANLHATHHVARQLASSLSRLDALILNAGIGVGPYRETQDGIDAHMQINVISQHLLTLALLPLLTKTPDSRLVYQSSEFHRLNVSDVSFASLSEINTDVGASKLYARSKLAQVLLVGCLSRRKTAGQLGRAPGKSPWINAVHPGGVNTDQPEQSIAAYGTAGKLGVKAARMVMKDPVDEGCRPALFAATSPDVGRDEWGAGEGEAVDGEYIVPDRKVTGVGKQAGREELGERLWRLVEGVLREKVGEEAVRVGG